MRASRSVGRLLLGTVGGLAVLISAGCGSGSVGASGSVRSVTQGAATVAAPSSTVPSSPPSSPAARPAVVKLPPVNGRFDYQLGGVYPPPAAVTIVDRDRTAAPVPGKYNICYVNAFQTQPGEAAFWTGSRSALLLKKADGKYLIDPDWPDEYLLDTSTAAKRKRIAGVVNGWIDGCARAGFQAVEPDNLDSWTRSKSRLTKANNVALATLLAAHAHGLGLAIAQKNTAELGRTGKTGVKFDFAIAEECQVYDECGAYLTPYGKHVIEIEYTDNPRSAYTRACAAQGKTITVILRDRDVVAKGRPGYRYEAC